MTASFRTTRSARPADAPPAPIVFVVTDDFTCSVNGQMMKFHTGDVIDRAYLVADLQAMRLGDKMRISSGQDTVVCCPQCRHSFLAD